jgi:hypothetical protein
MNNIFFFVLFANKVIRLRDILHFRCMSILRRSTGVLKSANALIHHFNPACRASRLCPELSVSRLLLALNDFDLPLESSLAKLRRTSDLFQQALNVLTYYTYPIVYGSLACLSVLPYFLQDFIFECIISLFWGLLLLVLYFMGKVSIVIPILLVLVILSPCIYKAIDIYANKRKTASIQDISDDKIFSPEPSIAEESKFNGLFDDFNSMNVLARKMKKRADEVLVDNILGLSTAMISDREKGLSSTAGRNESIDLAANLPLKSKKLPPIDESPQKPSLLPAHSIDMATPPDTPVHSDRSIQRAADSMHDVTLKQQGLVSSQESARRVLSTPDESGRQRERSRQRNRGDSTERRHRRRERRGSERSDVHERSHRNGDGEDRHHRRSHENDQEPYKSARKRERKSKHRHREGSAVLESSHVREDKLVNDSVMQLQSLSLANTLPIERTSLSVGFQSTVPTFPNWHTMSAPNFDVDEEAVEEAEEFELPVRTVGNRNAPARPSTGNNSAFNPLGAASLTGGIGAGAEWRLATASRFVNIFDNPANTAPKKEKDRSQTDPHFPAWH